MLTCCDKEDRVLLFGGTFDPPHIGHVNNLKAAIEAVHPTRVILMPAGVPPHKAASTTPAELRLAMCSCFEQACGQMAEHFELSDWEIQRAQQGYKNYTVHTLRMLTEKYPGARLYFSMGSDMLEEFQLWYEWQQILKLTTLVVQSREPGDLPLLQQAAKKLEERGGKVLLADEPAIPMASSDIRKGKFGWEALPEAVIDVVLQNGLYGMQMDEDCALRLAKLRLREKRFNHTVNVRNLAVELAQQYGADTKKAAVAALLHDTAKELPREEMLQIIRDNAIISDNAEARPEPVWHGICAAILAETKWGVKDEEILSAIRCHTTGKENMSLLDKIIYLADMTSAERNYPEVDYLRRREKEDIEKAIAEALQMSLDWLAQSGKPIDPITRDACAYYSRG